MHNIMDIWYKYNPIFFTAVVLECTHDSWWRHQMETFFALLAICAGNPLVIGQWRGTLMFSLIYAWIKGWVNNREAGDLRRHRAHYEVILIYCPIRIFSYNCNNLGKCYGEMFITVLIRTFGAFSLRHNKSCVYENSAFSAQVFYNSSHCINSPPSGQNGHHFPDDIFRCVFVNEKFVFWLKVHWSLFLRVQLTTSQHWII